MKNVLIVFFVASTMLCLSACSSPGGSTEAPPAPGGPAVTAPAAPSGLTATPVSSTQINLGWTDNSSNETGFKIERSSTSGTAGFAEITVTASGATGYNDTGLTAPMQYWYRVRATNTGGDSSCTLVATATTQVQFGTPTNIAVVQNGYPSLPERTSAVYINAVRMAPTDFRMKFLGGPAGILVSYPAVKPVAFHYDLNRAARFHSIDCTTHNIFQHNSFDGTTFWARIVSFFPGATATGEVMAGGPGSAFSAVNLLLVDGGAADHSGDGRRAMIMDAAARQVGAGLDAATWTIDFVSNAPAALPPIVTACHDFVTTGMITFWLNYYDAGGAGPKKIACFVDGVEQALALDMGTAAQGTYKVTLPKSTTTRAYYFLALDSACVTWRYPGPGTFMTVGEGAGTTDYVP
jgi:hypothetical protein